MKRKNNYYLQQTYLQSNTIRLEEMRIKRRDSEQWMHHRVLPAELQERVRRYDQYKWLETRGVDEESIVQSLPKDLRRDIKRHLCLNLVTRVSSLLSSSFSAYTSEEDDRSNIFFPGSSVCKYG